VFEARKRRTLARTMKLLPPHLLPGEQVRLVGLAVANDRSLGYWLPIAAVASFAVWAVTRPDQSFILYGVLLVILWFVTLLQALHVRWVVVTDRRFLVLKMNMPSGRGLDVERADALRSDSIVSRFSSVLGHGFVYRSIGGRHYRFRMHSQYLPELEDILDEIHPSEPPPAVSSSPRPARTDRSSPADPPARPDL
jgi:hypothetical protein